MNGLKESQKSFFLQEFQKKMHTLAGNALVMEKRKEAFALLQAEKKTKKSELWHYTHLGKLLPEFFSPREDASYSLAPFIENAYLLRRGVMQTQKISGLLVEPFSATLEDGSSLDFLKTYGTDDFIGALNTSFVEDGFSLSCEENLILDRPIEWQNIQEGGQGHTRFIFRAPSCVHATVIERPTLRNNAFASSVSNVYVGDESHLHWFILHDSCHTSSYFSLLDVEMGKNAQLWIWMIHTGGKVCRQELRIKMPQENAQVHFSAVNLLSGQRHGDITMVIEHQAPHTFSYESVRNVLLDQSLGVFQGNIYVDDRAQKTEAKMSCSTLLLSDDAQFFVKPALEIFADDVVCAHGATIADIHPDAPFYLMARGIPREEARALLIKAFMSDLLDKIPQDALRDVVQKKIDQWLCTHI